MGRLRSLFRLTPAERSIALRSHAWLLASRIALRVFPFTAIRRFVDGRPAPRARRDNLWPHAVRRGMMRAARTLPGSSCLARALAAEVLLRAGGHPALLIIGVSEREMPGVPLDAHAWVESGGHVVAGDGELETYTSLVRFGAPT